MIFKIKHFLPPRVARWRKFNRQFMKISSCKINMCQLILLYLYGWGSLVVVVRPATGLLCVSFFTREFEFTTSAVAVYTTCWFFVFSHTPPQQLSYTASSFTMLSLEGVGEPILSNPRKRQGSVDSGSGLPFLTYYAYYDNLSYTLTRLMNELLLLIFNMLNRYDRLWGSMSAKKSGSASTKPYFHTTKQTFSSH